VPRIKKSASRRRDLANLLKHLLRLRDLPEHYQPALATCPISAYARAYNKLRYVFGVVWALGRVCRIVIRNIRGQPAEHKFLSEIGGGT
jgi:hypothetical protein